MRKYLLALLLPLSLSALQWQNTETEAYAVDFPTKAIVADSTAQCTWKGTHFEARIQDYAEPASESEFLERIKASFPGSKIAFIAHPKATYLAQVNFIRKPLAVRLYVKDNQLISFVVKGKEQSSAERFFQSIRIK